MLAHVVYCYTQVIMATEDIATAFEPLNRISPTLRNVDYRTRRYTDEIQNGGGRLLEFRIFAITCEPLTEIHQN